MKLSHSSSQDASYHISATSAELKAPLQWMVHTAWITPAVMVAIASVRTMLQPKGVAPHVAIALLTAAIWIGLSFRASWRGLMIDITSLLLSRLGFPALLLITAAFLVIGISNSFGAFFGGVGISLCILTLVAAIISLIQDARHFIFQLVLISLNIGILTGLDYFIGIYVLPYRSHNQIIVDHDPQLGWKLRAGISVTHKDKLYVSTESINNFGFRTSEIPIEKTSHKKRIVFLGDSHTEAYTVSDGETYTKLVEAKLSENQPVEVVSLGVGGYSTDQELLAYLHYGRRYKPDLVVLQFCSNDVRHNVLDRYWRGLKPYFERHGEVLMLQGVPVPNLRNTGFFGPKLMQKSSLVLLLESILRQLAVTHMVEKEADLEEGWKVTRLLIRDLNTIVRNDGAHLLVFNVDSKMDEVDRRLRVILQEFAIPYLETAEVYVDDFNSYWVSGHWNRKGQRAIADALSLTLSKFLQSSEGKIAETPTSNLLFSNRITQ
ncbi:MAG: GDSL-type esterase/lipase family protein [bacterium]